MGGAQTNGDGTYTISGLPSGTFRVAANAPGYAMEYFDDKYRDNPDPVTVTVGETTGNVNFHLGIGATIQGRITDNITHEGVGGVVVNADFDNWGHGTCTNDQGYYTLESVPLGIDFRMRVDAGQWNWCGTPTDYEDKFYINTTDRGQAYVFNLTPATKDQTEINIALDKFAFISGYVKDEANNPIEGAQIYTEWFGFNDQPQATTDEDGYYRVNVPSSGQFSVRAVAPGFAMEFYNDAGRDWNNATMLSASPSQEIPNIDFELAKGGMVSGRVTEDDGVTPVARMRVGIDNMHPSVCTDDDGYYTLIGVPVDAPVMVTTMGGMWCGNGDQYLQQSFGPITLTEADPNETVDFLMVLGGTVSGLVTDAVSSDPVDNVSVNVGWDGGGAGTCTNPDGSYTVFGIALDVEFTVSAGGGGCPNGRLRPGILGRDPQPGERPPPYGDGSGKGSSPASTSR